MNFLAQMESYAQENHVPIMEKEGITFLKQYIKEHHIKEILEIGTAIGYSAIQMAFVDPSIHVTTIERDGKRYLEALEWIRQVQLEDQITVFLADALDTEVKGTFDLIFIDAAKAQYQKFFEKYEPQLKKGGVIVTDNLFFHGLTSTDQPILSRNLRSLVRKINEYTEYLKNHPRFETTIYEVGDGVAISKQKEEI